MNEGSFISYKDEIIPDKDGALFRNTLGLWDSTGEMLLEYFSIEYEWIPPSGEEIDLSRNRENNFHSCATAGGKVFYSRFSTDRFEMHGCMPDGTEFLLIEDGSVHPVRKTEAEIQAEEDSFNSLINLMRGSSTGSRIIREKNKEIPENLRCSHLLLDPF